MWLVLRSHSKWQNYHFEPRWCDSRVYALKHSSIWIRELRYHRNSFKVLTWRSDHKNLFSCSSIQYCKCTANPERRTHAGAHCTVIFQQITEPWFLRGEWGHAARVSWSTASTLCLLCCPAELILWDLKLTLFRGTTFKDTELWMQSYEHLCIYYEK